MSLTSRTSKSIKNAKVSLAFYVLTLSLTFISRKVFIDNLGLEVLGLNTTATNLLGILNLAELGISSAVSFSLYKPIYNNERETINEIVSVQSFWYRKIGLFIILSSLVTIIFFPLIFKNISIPFWYTYSTFLVLVFSSLLSYFFNYKQIILIADQNDYKVTLQLQGWKTVKVIFQILLISLTNHGYIYWLFTEIIFSILLTLSLNHVINKSYPWLVADHHIGKEVHKKYKELTQKIKQLFFHKLSGYILLQTSPLILYGYSSLSLVAIYGNYLLIVSGFSLFINAAYNNVNSSIGNLVAENDKSKIENVFWEIFNLRFITVTISCLIAFLITTPIVKQWFGEEYILSNETLLLIIIIMFLNTMRGVVDGFINAYGLFKDVWATATESILNLSLSIILGSYFGLNGILCGILISLFPAILIWKPYFCFTQGFKSSPLIFFKNVIFYLILAFSAFFLTSLMIKAMIVKSILKEDSILSIFTNIASFSFMIICSMYISNSATRRITKRILRRIKVSLR